uniref:Centrosomal protein of 70 kDa n=2 Tax=Clytia hemisphaerica TaxID=252671 RepID=A0A7M5WWU8_9CNID
WNSEFLQIFNHYPLGIPLIFDGFSLLFVILGLSVFNEETSDILRKTLLHLIQENDKKQKTIGELQKLGNNISKRNIGSSPIKPNQNGIDQTKHRKKRKEHRPSNKWSMNMTSSIDDRKEKDIRYFMEQKYSERINSLQDELDVLRKSIESFDISKTKTSRNSDILPQERDKHSTDKKPLPNNVVREQQHQLKIPQSQHKQITEDRQHSQRGETHRSKKSEDTAIALETLLDDIYLKDATSAKKYKKKCASLKSQIHILQSENQQLSNALEMKNEKNSHQNQIQINQEVSSSDEGGFPTYRISPRYCGAGADGSARPTSTSGQVPSARDKHYNGNIRPLSTARQMASARDHSTSEAIKLLENLNEIVTGESGMTYIEILDNRIELLRQIMEWKADQSRLEEIYDALQSLQEELAPPLNPPLTATTAGKPPTLMFGASPSQSQDILKLIQNMRRAYKKNQEPIFTNIDLSEDSLTSDQMRAVIHHFMKLFDVKKESAVYTRIYDLYNRYYEVLNALNSIHHMLHLKKENGVNDIVNAVGKLTKLKKHLRAQKIDRVMNQVEQYDQFYEAFHKLVQELKDTLGVSELEDILPAVKLLQQ